MEIIKNIEEVIGLQLNRTGSYEENNNLRIAPLRTQKGFYDPYSKYDGYRITTTEHEYLFLVYGEQNCCEQWGYFASDDSANDYIGKTLVATELTDVALDTRRVEESGYYEDGGGIQFVNLKMSDGGVLQLSVYNAHNGYYGHPIIFAKDMKILHQDTL